MKSNSWIQIEYNEFLYLNSYINEHSMGLYVSWATINHMITQIMSIPPKTTPEILGKF